MSERLIALPESVRPKERVDLNQLLGNLDQSPIRLQQMVAQRMITKMSTDKNINF